jgi:hypothetical protein
VELERGASAWPRRAVDHNGWQAQRRSELMVHEVQKRQSDGKNPQRRVAELLLGDKRHQSQAAAQGQTQQDTDMETFQELNREPGPSAMEQEGQAQVGSPEYSEERFSSNDMPSQAPEATYNHEGAQETNSTPNMKAPVFLNTPTRTPAVQLPQSTEKLNESLQLDALEMRARAKRLRGQAMRLEAEALDLESEAAMARRVLNS